jgi:hypothetical protein
VSGEPVTAARAASIRAAGAEVLPRYAAMETGVVAGACTRPVAPDDVHVYHDLNAIIQPAGAEQSLLYATSMRPMARLVLLNASLGDEATLDERTCGCPLAELGWTTHLHNIRSREKLTAAGMTFPDRDLMRVLDEVLPARFGGGPTDYQLVEEERADGQSRLRLLVRPSVGAADLGAIKEAFLDAISAGSGAERIMGTVWRTADLLTVEERPPLSGFSGKILHLHQQSGAAPGT